MDPINILTAVAILVSVSANIPAAKKGFKSTISIVIERPKTYLQKIPPNISALILVLQILGIFGIGAVKIESGNDLYPIRLAGLIIFSVFAWLQVLSYKTLGNSYSQEIVVMKNQGICKKGIYRFIRHPQYLSQILSDFGAGLALASFLIVPVVLLIELPLFILRARLEEKLLLKNYSEEYLSYKKKSGFFIPFIG